MAPTLTAPNTDNYLVGKGIVTFKRAGASTFVDLGNVTELEYTPEIENLDHYSSRQGVRTKDKSIVLEKGGTLRLVMEEFTPHNVALIMLGTVDELAPGGPTIDIFAANAVEGELKYTATNEVGPKWDMHFLRVSFSPSGGFNPISEEWASMEITGDALVDTVTGKVGTMTLTNLSSES